MSRIWNPITEHEEMKIMKLRSSSAFNVELNGDGNDKSARKLSVCSAASAADAPRFNVAVGEI